LLWLVFVWQADIVAPHNNICFFILVFFLFLFALLVRSSPRYDKGEEGMRLPP
jgi:hypothetical protein